MTVEGDNNVDNNDDSEANATKERNDDDGEDVEVDARTCSGPGLQHDSRQHRVAHQRHHTWPGDNGGGRQVDTVVVVVVVVMMIAKLEVILIVTVKV